MNIKWHGRSCITVKSKSAKVVVDPQAVDMKPGKINAELVLSTQQGDIDEYVKDGETRVFSWPGEYEAANVSVHIVAFNDVNVVIFEIDDVIYCSLGNLKEKLPEEIVEKIGNVDVLFVPVGGNEKVMDHKNAIIAVEQIEPRIVVPFNFNSEGTGDDLNGPEGFMKEVGKPAAEAQENFSTKSAPDDRTEYVLLKAV